MAKILVIISVSRYSEKIIDEAFLQARDDPNPEMCLLYIIEKDEMEQVRSQMESTGFLGGKPADRVMRALLEDRKARGKKFIATFMKMAEMAKIPAQTTEVTGNYSDKVIEHVEKEVYDYIFMVKSQQSFLSRLLHGSEVDKVVRYTRANQDSTIRVIK